ncbi:hypothetical protein CR513_08129, partial [Mucuna pruriens]
MSDSSKSSLSLPTSVIIVEDKIVILGPNELLNLVGSSRLDYRNCLRWVQYIHTYLKRRKKLSHIEGGDPPRNDSKFETWDDNNSLILTSLWNCMTIEISWNYIFYFFARRIFKFLHDLNSEYDLIWVQILSKEKLSSLSKVFSTMWGEET